MSIFAATSLVAGIGSSLLGNRHAKKMARRQQRLAQEEAQKIRDRAAESRLASEREIESLRVMRGMGLPAFRQASEQAYIQAQKGAERIARQRTMGRLSPDVRQAIFGGQFQQYVGREQQRLQQYAGLTERILRATETQQQMAMQAEQGASQISYGGQAQAIQMRAAAGDVGANILGAVGQAAAAYGQSLETKAAAGQQSQDSFLQALAVEGYTPEQISQLQANPAFARFFPKQEQ